MIHYKRGSEVTMNDIYKGFSIGFSDYMIKLQLSEEEFEKRFFGPEGNSLELTLVAFDGKVPVAVLLGGIRHWEGIKTIRCGALAVHPDYRGLGISQALMRLHGEDFKENKCHRMSLEVIKGNDRALKFYEKEGYIKTGSLKYYHVEAEKLLSSRSEYERDHAGMEVGLVKCSWKTLSESRKKRSQHIHWQCEPSYYEHSALDHHYLIEHEGKEVGMCSVSEAGRINYLWINPEQRLKGYGSCAIVALIREFQLGKCHMALASNPNMECFAAKLGFVKDALEQYEMFKVVKHRV